LVVREFGFNKVHAQGRVTAALGVITRTGPNNPDFINGGISV
jgi:hypothetical protein